MAINKDFSTIGTTPVTKEVRRIDHGINKSFIAKKLFVIGEIVELQSDGEVDQVSEQEAAIGVVTVKNTKITTDDVTDREKRVTVITPFRQIINANVKTAGAVTRGLLVKFDAADSQTDGIPNVLNGTSTDWCFGIALQTGAADTTVEIGVLYHGVLKP